MTADAGHKLFGGSSAHRWMRCAGSVRLTQQAPPQIETAAMRSGTHAHKLLEVLLGDGLGPASEYVGTVLIDGHAPLTEDDCAAVQVAVDYVAELLERYHDAELYAERKLALEDDTGGTCDIQLYVPSTKTLHVIDYKHGAGVYVDVEDNEQLLFYAVLAWYLGEWDVKVVNCTIIQPRCSVGEPVRTMPRSPAELLDFHDRIYAARALAGEPDAPFVPGEKQCKWCTGAFMCPALHNVGVDLAAAAGMLAPSAPTEAITLILPPVEECRDPRGLAQTLQAAAVLEAWIDAIKERAEALALSGQKLPGYKLVAKRPTRKWLNEDEAGPALVTAITGGSLEGVEQAWEQIAPPTLVSVAQAETILKTALGGKKNAEAFLAKISEKKSSGLKLVPEGAPGEAIDPLQLASVDFAGAVTLD